MCVSIVTFNSERYIRRCLEGVLEQEGVATEIVVVDNASTDGTRAILRRFKNRIRTIYNDRNLGFAEAQNQAIRASAADWVLTLNPDVLLVPRFIAHALWRPASPIRPPARSAASCSPSAPDSARSDEPRIDSTGIFFTPAMRHFDRGWHEPDSADFDSHGIRLRRQRRRRPLPPRHDRRRLHRRRISSIPISSCYREDADVAWRAQLLGWRCIYTPAAWPITCAP